MGISLGCPKSAHEAPSIGALMPYGLLRKPRLDPPEFERLYREWEPTEPDPQLRLDQEATR